MININIRSLKIAKRYALALTQSAKDNIDEIAGDLASIEEIIFDNESLRTFFLHPNISLNDKKKVLKEAFEGKINPLSHNFLETLLNENRFSIFKTICEVFKKEVNLIKNRCEVEVISAIELDSEQKNNLQNKLNQKFQKETLINYILDSSVLGGLIIKFDDSVIDLSLKTKFDSLRKEAV